MKLDIVRSLLLGLVFAGLSAGATENSAQMRSLDNQVQEIKSDVLAIAAELSNLEERLLYPSNSQLSVFIAMGSNEKFRLDAVHLKINGDLATHHIYSYQELEALKKGGVQRIYTGNVSNGDHQLEVRMIGKLANGNDFEEAASFVVNKGVSPRAVGLTLASPASASAPISIGDW